MSHPTRSILRLALALVALLLVLLPGRALAGDDCSDGPVSGVNETVADLGGALGGEPAGEAVPERPAADLSALIDRALAGDRVDVPALVDSIHQATTAERQAVLGDSGRMQALRAALNKVDGLVVMASLLEGSQTWRNPTGNDFFAQIVGQRRDTPVSTDATMNCWEAMLHAGMLDGQVTGDFVRQFYDRALRAADPNKMIWYQLGFYTDAARHPVTDSSQPAPGQLVFWVPSGSSMPSHVALAVGNGEVISLWNQPDNNYSAQRIKISDLAGDAYYGDPPW